MRISLLSITVAMTFGALASVAWSAPDNRPPSLSDLLAQPPNSSEAVGINEIRFNAIRETALTFGMQAGLARRNAEIIKKLEASATSLDVVYNFQPLMLEGNVVPPVMIEANDVYEQKNDNVIRIIGNSYLIASQPRLTYAPPTWRSYLLHDYSFDRNALLAVSPASSRETELWKEFVTEGYRRGEEQAERIFEENLSRLKRDFEGMVRYRTLLAKGMVTRPFVASSHTGVVGRKDGYMNVSETILQITATPEFVLDSTQWNAQPAANVQDRLRQAAHPERGRALVEGSGVVKDRSGYVYER